LERQNSAPYLGERTANLNNARKDRAYIVTAHGQARVKKNISCAFYGADGHAALIVLDVQVAVAENLHAWHAASRSGRKKNGTTPASPRAAVGNERGTAGCRGIGEVRCPTVCAADRAAI